MVRIAPVALQYNPRTLWFDPGDLDLSEGDAVVVKTEKGTEFGHSSRIVDVSEEAIENLASPLQPVLRRATEEDLRKVDDLRLQSDQALPVFKRLAAEADLAMRPIMVEFTFEGDRAVFFFEAEQRVDFRDLVRKLASEFHVRIDMRQIGVRDEARIVGGLGHCGQELCCRRLGGEFCPVSIRMAKEQDLSLNPQKISGACGRLMCCLRYEFDAYKEFHSRCPKQNAKISTPCGMAKVTSLNVPRERVTVRLEDDGKQVTFPLSAMDDPAPDVPSKRPTSIGEAFEEFVDPDPFEHLASAPASFNTAAFTREDKPAPAQVHHNPHTQTSEQSSSSQLSSVGSSHRTRRRRTRSQASSTSSGHSSSSTSTVRSSQVAAPRPGQKSSGIRRKSTAHNASAAKTHDTKMHDSKQSRRKEGASSATAPAPRSHRTPRRRRSEKGRLDE
ncbi:PSP1 domain-containing protein [Cryptobacterium curtum]